MNTIRRISEKVATPENFIQGFVNYADGKPPRTDIRKYEENLAANIKTQVKAFITGTWSRSGMFSILCPELRGWKPVSPSYPT